MFTEGFFMHTIKQLFIYPIKGCKAITVDSAFAEERGLSFDRRLMLIDQNNLFISQRSHPLIAQITPTLNDQNIGVEFQDKTITFNIDHHTSNKITAQLFENTVEGFEVSSAVSEWFSSMLHEKMKLIVMDDSILRIKKLSKQPQSTEVSYADGYPYLILGTASINHLNSKLPYTIGPDRFRPNIYIDTDIPHIEDT